MILLLAKERGGTSIGIGRLSSSNEDGQSHETAADEGNSGSVEIDQGMEDRMPPLFVTKDMKVVERKTRSCLQYVSPWRVIDPGRARRAGIFSIN